MNRKLIAAAVVLVSLVSAAPVFAHDWNDSAWTRHERFVPQRGEIARDRAELRHDLYVHNRFGAHNEREIVRDRADLRHDLWARRF
jgi:hypothetical protein